MSASHPLRRRRGVGRGCATHAPPTHPDLPSPASPPLPPPPPRTFPVCAMPVYFPVRSSCRRVLMTSIGCRHMASATPPRLPLRPLTTDGTGGRGVAACLASDEDGFASAMAE
eukprot:354429-Chlamydomonas_euryale.AAC.3